MKNLTTREKTDALIEALDDNRIVIIDLDSIAGIDIDAQLVIDEDEDIYSELLEKGLTEEDLDSLNSFLSGSTLILVDDDKISGVSFLEIESTEILHNFNLWNEEE